MPKALTTGAMVVCSHQGRVQILSAGQGKLKVGAAFVLVDGDLVGKSISGCLNNPTPANPSFKPCTSTTSMIAGAATRLKVGTPALPVLLENANGMTDSVPPGTWSVQSPGQTKLDTS
jgi:hypothetical protein